MKKELAGGLPGITITEEMIRWFGVRWDFARRDPNFDPRWGNKNKSFQDLCKEDDVVKLGYAFHFMIECHSVKFNQESPARLSIEIDFNKVNSIDDLKKHIWEMISQYWQHYLNKYNHRVHKEQKDFEQILQVGAMKENNLDYKAIAETLFADVSGPSGEKRARRYYEEYLKLVNGGWRSLTYP